MTDKKKKKALDAEITEALLDDFDKFEHFAVSYWKQIVYACIAIVIIVAISATGLKIRNSIRERAVTAITAAETKDELEKVITEYAGNPAIYPAMLDLAVIYTKEKKYDEAMKAYSAISSKVPAGEELKLKAEMNICYLLELRNEKQEAALRFAQISRDPSAPEAYKAEAAYSAGRILLKLKENVRALKSLNLAIGSSVSNQATAFWATQAQRLLDGIEKKPAEG